jgi:predicted GNAT family acetyltransferase
MEIDLDKVEVINHRDARRFETRGGDYFALIDYLPAGKNIVFTHTEVPVIFEGQGVGSKMAQTALEYARDEGLKVVPLCPFVAAYIRHHPEYQPLVFGFEQHLKKEASDE